MSYFVITKTLLFVDGEQKSTSVEVDEHKQEVDAYAVLRNTAEQAVFKDKRAKLVKYETLDGPAKNPVRLDYEFTEEGRYRYEISLRVVKDVK